MRKNIRFIANMLEVMIGVALTCLGYAGILDSFWSGMGTALIIVGIIFMVRQIRYRTNEAYKENVDVAVNDERNKFLKIKSWSWAGYSFVMIGAVGSIILRIVGLDQLSTFAAGCVCLIMVLYCISYAVLKRKY